MLNDMAVVDMQDSQHQVVGTAVVDMQAVDNHQVLDMRLVHHAQGRDMVQGGLQVQGMGMERSLQVVVVVVHSHLVLGKGKVLVPGGRGHSPGVVVRTLVGVGHHAVGQHGSHHWVQISN